MYLFISDILNLLTLLTLICCLIFLKEVSSRKSNKLSNGIFKHVSNLEVFGNICFLLNLRFVSFTFLCFFKWIIKLLLMAKILSLKNEQQKKKEGKTVEKEFTVILEQKKSKIDRKIKAILI